MEVFYMIKTDGKIEVIGFEKNGKVKNGKGA
jgi:hypothetical protein